MPTSTKFLPEALAGTKLHLFNLVTSTVYRDGHNSSAYDIVPKGDGLGGQPGNGGRKWGYDANLPSGAAAGGADPGRYRIYRWIVAGKHTWWVLKHLPANTYQFNKIAIPKCPTCKGTADIVCPTCKGSRRDQTIPNFSTPCATCLAHPTAAIPCPACTPNPVIVDGYSIDKTYANW